MSVPDPSHGRSPERSPTIQVRVARRFDASSERVFDAWLDPARARRFLFATGAGEMLRCEIDPRVGGRFLIVERREGGDAEHHGRYVVIDRPRRLVFDYGVDADESGWTRVTIDIAPAGAGCELTLVHEMGAEWSEYRERTERGWTNIVEGLERVVR